jgi:secernin
MGAGLMCDTVALLQDGTVLFAKNSDREPREAQRVERHEAVTGDTAARLRCTHIEIDQVPDRLATLLCRPDWMWGAEMGVNAAGVAIGNEAVFSRRVMRRGEALLGMDLVRLGLERGATAQSAAAVIVQLLERHGQGGPAGFSDKRFRYDNSFLIADADDILVLETCGRDWLLKRYGDRAAISNAYTIDGGADAASDGAPPGGFAPAREGWLMRTFGRACTLQGLEAMATPDLAAMAQLMRRHDRGDGFARGSNRDVCMHAGGLLRPHATTNTLMVRLEAGQAPKLAVTGTPAPCVSLFRPAGFEGSWSAFDPVLWERAAGRLDALAADAPARELLRARIAAAERHILPLIEQGEAAMAEEMIRAWDAHEFDAPSEGGGGASGSAEIEAPLS